MIITARAKRRELWVALGCFVAAFGVNLGAIIHYATPWYELFSQLGYVVCLALGFYVLTWIVRGIVRIFRRR